MANKMLIDATHPEETRVVVLRGNRVEEFDFESANRRQLRGNIYLAQVTRVEPSLQAAFVDYGGNRHGFLAFSEIHPDYYQIPVADRQALIDEEERAHRDAEAEADRRAGMRRRPRHRAAGRHSESIAGEPGEGEAAENANPAGEQDHPGDQAALPEAERAGDTPAQDTHAQDTHAQDTHAQDTHAQDTHAQDTHAQDTHAQDGEQAEGGLAAAAPHAVPDEDSPETTQSAHSAFDDETATLADEEAPPLADEGRRTEEAEPLDAGDGAPREDDGNGDETTDGESADGDEEDIVESVGGADAMEEVQDRTPRYRRQYKIQEVIKRRQIMLVQVVKEERGTKGAALTTYLSLAGRVRC